MKAVVALIVVVLSCYLNNVQAQQCDNSACTINGDCCSNSCEEVTTKTCNAVCNGNSCSGSGTNRPDGALCSNGGQCMNPPCKKPSAQFFCSGGGNCGTC